jgi:hypothetical protein
VMCVAFFYVYTRFRRLDRQLTLLVRKLAIQHAEVGLVPTSSAPPPKRPESGPS